MLSHVPDRTMTTHTRHLGARSVAGVDVFDDAFVTLSAGAFRDAAIARFYPERVWEIARSEGKGMPKSVIGFGQILRDEAVRSVAIVACGGRTMAALNPGVEVVLHDVAIRAGCGVIGKIGGAFRIDEGVAGNPRRDANHRPDNCPSHHAGLHSRVTIMRRRRQGKNFHAGRTRKVET